MKKVAKTFYHVKNKLYIRSISLTNQSNGGGLRKMKMENQMKNLIAEVIFNNTYDRGQTKITKAVQLENGEYRVNCKHSYSSSEVVCDIFHVNLENKTIYRAATNGKRISPVFNVSAETAEAIDYHFALENASALELLTILF